MCINTNSSYVIKIKKNKQGHWTGMWIAPFDPLPWEYVIAWRLVHHQYYLYVYHYSHIIFQLKFKHNKALLAVLHIGTYRYFSLVILTWYRLVPQLNIVTIILCAPSVVIGLPYLFRDVRLPTSIEWIRDGNNYTSIALLWCSRCSSQSVRQPFKL